MERNFFLVTGGSLEEHELRLIGELIGASYNAHNRSQLSKQMEKDKDSGALEKHSAYLKKSMALKFEAETYRLLSCLYESTADRPAVSKFLDELVDLIK